MPGTVLGSKWEENGEELLCKGTHSPVPVRTISIYQEFRKHLMFQESLNTPNLFCYLQIILNTSQKHLKILSTCITLQEY